ncbi:hypothetical protein TWF730_001386 [Orbilia blumenaviensis]|uniref:Uncharacterized protein n=1 Tax=Orbilia blumenaviensis TaxID=1796055 RepID=A0AAV9UHJ9_9PEZI
MPRKRSRPRVKPQGSSESPEGQAKRQCSKPKHESSQSVEKEEEEEEGYVEGNFYAPPSPPSPHDQAQGVHWLDPAAARRQGYSAAPTNYFVEGDPYVSPPHALPGNQPDATVAPERVHAAAPVEYVEEDLYSLPPHIQQRYQSQAGAPDQGNVGVGVMPPAPASGAVQMEAGQTGYVEEEDLYTVPVHIQQRYQAQTAEAAEAAALERGYAAGYAAASANYAEAGFYAHTAHIQQQQSYPSQAPAPDQGNGITPGPANYAEGNFYPQSHHVQQDYQSQAAVAATPNQANAAAPASYVEENLYTLPPNLRQNYQYHAAATTPGRFNASENSRLPPAPALKLVASDDSMGLPSSSALSGSLAAESQISPLQLPQQVEGVNNTYPRSGYDNRIIKSGPVVPINETVCLGCYGGSHLACPVGASANCQTHNRPPGDFEKGLDSNVGFQIPNAHEISPIPLVQKLESMARQAEMDIKQHSERSRGLSGSPQVQKSGNGELTNSRGAHSWNSQLGTPQQNRPSDGGMDVRPDAGASLQPVEYSPRQRRKIVQNWIEAVDEHGDPEQSPSYHGSGLDSDRTSEGTNQQQSDDDDDQNFTPRKSGMKQKPAAAHSATPHGYDKTKARSEQSAKSEIARTHTRSEAPRGSSRAEILVKVRKMLEDLPRFRDDLARCRVINNSWSNTPGTFRRAETINWPQIDAIESETVATIPRDGYTVSMLHPRNSYNILKALKKLANSPFEMDYRDLGYERDWDKRLAEYIGVNPDIFQSRDPTPAGSVLTSEEE